MNIGVLEIRDDGAIVKSGVVLTTMTDWGIKTRIPTVAAPARLPPGTGAMILNAIAVRAQGAGIAALRYAGPYPTPALYRSLLRSFRTDASEADFTADVLGRALRLATDELPFDFTPAPHRRVEHARGWSELRDELERTVIDAVSFEAAVGLEGDAVHDRHLPPARLVTTPRDSTPERGRCTQSPLVRAEIWLGDAPYAVVAELAADGSALAYFDLPVCTSPVLSRAFPPPLRAAIAGLVAELVPAPLAPDVQRLIAERPLVWADLGARTAQAYADGSRAHTPRCGIASPTHRPRASALAVAEALAPVAATRVLAELNGIH